MVSSELKFFNRSDAPQKREKDVTEALYVGHSRLRLSKLAIGYLHSQGNRVAEIDEDSLSENVSKEATVFIEGGEPFHERYFFILPDRSDKRSFYAVQRGIYIPDWAKTARKLVSIRLTPHGDIHRGEDYNKFCAALDRLHALLTATPSRTRRSRNSRRHGHIARVQRDRNENIL